VGHTSRKRMLKKACALLSLEVKCTSCPKSNRNSTLCTTCRPNLLLHAEPANRTHCLPQALHQVQHIHNLHIQIKSLLRATHTLLPYHTTHALTIHIQIPLLRNKSHDPITKSDTKIRELTILANLPVWSIAIRSEFTGKYTSMCVKVCSRIVSLRCAACALSRRGVLYPRNCYLVRGYKDTVRIVVPVVSTRMQ
jgi:hypothetical protein